MTWSEIRLHIWLKVFVSELVRQMYEGTDPVEVRRLLDLFNVAYVVVGDLEREKYTAINENIFGQLGTIVFSSNNTSLYKVH